MKTSVIFAAWIAFLAAPVQAVEPVTLANVVPPADSNKDEPLAKTFSMARALHFLDSAALSWQKEKTCFSCHSNYAFLYARPAIAGNVQAHAEIRKFAEDLVSDRWVKGKPRWDMEVVTAAAALAFNDAQTTGKLHPLTRTALDRMWTVQRKDGGWKWLNCGWPPMESDDHYGVTLAAIAVGVAPQEYARTEAARKGMEGVRRYLKENPPTMLHQRAMTLWAAGYVPDLMTPEERKACIKDLLAQQRPDGGWAAATLGDWPRGDGTEQDKHTSDGYGTGFVIYVLRRSGVPAADPALKKGVAWLKLNQRESGRWFTRSLFRDNKHYLTHAGTAFAIMALAACEER